MRVARIITVLNRRREWIVGRMENAHEQSRPWLGEEKRAIDAAIPILQAELERRQLEVMEQRTRFEGLEGAKQ